jgi:hypothetical protein
MSQKAKAEPNRTSSGREIRRFAKLSDWEAWLLENHRSSLGIWLRLAKKGSGLQSVTYAEALEVALCYGGLMDKSLERASSPGYKDSCRGRLAVSGPASTARRRKR